MRGDVLLTVSYTVAFFLLNSRTKALTYNTLLTFRFLSALSTEFAFSRVWHWLQGFLRLTLAWIRFFPRLTHGLRFRACDTGYRITRLRRLVTLDTFTPVPRSRSLVGVKNLSHLSLVTTLPVPYTRHTRLSRFCRLIKSRELVPLSKVFISMCQTFFRVRFRAAFVPNLRKLNKFLFFRRALFYSFLLYFWLIGLLRLRYWQWFLFGLLNNYSECRDTQTGKLVYFWAGH